jgi:hypothetical protein
MPPSPHTEGFQQARAAAVETLASLIAGSIGLINASRKLSSLRHQIAGEDLDDDWRVFVGLDSETDHLPVGEERKHWQADALAKKDVEIKKSEGSYRDRAIVAAQNLLKRYTERKLTTL